MVQRFRVEFGVLALLLGMATAGHAADHDAVISGVVRDARGVPQMGAIVQILAANASIRATTFTDMQGHYLVRSLLPGRYGVRATAALFVPAVRENLRLQPDRRAVVNLTLSALFDESAWLPAMPKGPTEPRDDWNWTLRSSAGKPILKLGDDDTLRALAGLEGPTVAHPVRVQARVESPSRGFGEGSSRASLQVEKLRRNGTDLSVSASARRFSQAGGASEIPGDMSFSIERPLGLGGMVASRVSYASHPEILGSGGGAGLRVLTVSSAEKFPLGDFAEIEAGNRVQSVSGPASAVATRPFVRVSAHPREAWMITYSLASARDTQDYDSAIWRESELPAVAEVNGKSETEKGRHQKIALSHRTKTTLLAIAYYADALDRVALSGGFEGLGDPAEAFTGAAGPMLVDGSNGSFRALIDGYRGSGLNLQVTQALGTGTWIAFQYCTGAALTASDAVLNAPVGELPEVHARKSQSATVALKAKAARTGTLVRAAYRWQPGVLLTSVDPYDVFAGGDFLSVHLRQPLMIHGIPVDALEITVDGNNVLGQGYQRFQERGDRPMYLASSPATLQAGLAFTF